MLGETAVIIIDDKVTYVALSQPVEATHSVRDKAGH